MALDPRILDQCPQPIKPGAISKMSDAGVVLAAISGSQSHGTNLGPDVGGFDDVDVLGAIMPMTKNIIGLHSWEHWVADIDELDVTFYSLHKLVRMWTNANPNVLPLLWMDPSSFVHSSVTFRDFVKIRDAFVSNQVIRAFNGYAIGQLKEMDREHEYRGYMGARRRALVDEFGYDPKYAAHAVRLLRMACEFSETATLIVLRPDADELKQIKTGQWRYQDIKRECEDRIAILKAWPGNPEIPGMPVTSRIDNLLVYVTHRWITEGWV